MGLRPLRFLLGPLLGAFRRRAAARGQTGRADVRPRPQDADRRSRTVVRERGECAREPDRRGSRVGFRRRALARGGVVARCARRHRRRGRHPRRADQFLYGAVPRQTDSQSDERCQRGVPPQRSDHRPRRRRPCVLFDVLAVGYLPGVASAANPRRYGACERHDRQPARHVRRDGRTARLASRLGRDRHDDRLSRRVGHSRRLSEGHPRLRRREGARCDDPLVEHQQEGFGILRGAGLHPVERLPRIGLLRPGIRL